MTFFVQLYLSDIRNVITLFILTGLVAYIIDYRFSKEVQGREKNFVKAVSYLYIFGGTLAFITMSILNWFI